ncbi:MAG: single-stranded DNA-binding protein [bacterium]
MYYNKIQLAGNVTKDAELKYTQSGSAILTFTIGVNKSYKNANGEKIEKSIFPNCVMFGKGAEALEQYITKGKGLFVEGELSLENYEDKDGVKKYATKILVREVKFTGGPVTENPKKSESEPEENYSGSDEDVPF